MRVLKEESAEARLEGGRQLAGGAEAAGRPCSGSAKVPAGVDLAPRRYRPPAPRRRPNLSAAVRRSLHLS